MRLASWLDTGCRWTLGGVFIVAGVLKASDPVVFATLIEAYGLVPGLLLMPVALALIALEIAAGAGLLLGVRGSLEAVTGMLVLFILVLAWGMHLGLDVDCGCFGPGDPEAEAFHGLGTTLLRDLAMLAAATWLFIRRRRDRRAADLPAALRQTS